MRLLAILLSLIILGSIPAISSGAGNPTPDQPCGGVYICDGMTMSQYEAACRDAGCAPVCRDTDPAPPHYDPPIVVLCPVGDACEGDDTYTTDTQGNIFLNSSVLKFEYHNFLCAHAIQIVSVLPEKLNAPGENVLVTVKFKTWCCDCSWGGMVGNGGIEQIREVSALIPKVWPKCDFPGREPNGVSNVIWLGWSKDCPDENNQLWGPEKIWPTNPNVKSNCDRVEVECGMVGIAALQFNIIDEGSGGSTSLGYCPYCSGLNYVGIRVQFSGCGMRVYDAVHWVHRQVAYCDEPADWPTGCLPPNNFSLCNKYPSVRDTYSVVFGTSKTCWVGDWPAHLGQEVICGGGCLHP